MTMALSNMPAGGDVGRRASDAGGLGTTTPPTISPRKQLIDLEIAKLWELFTKIRGAVSCKLVEAIVLAASQANNAEITAATLPPMAADLDWPSFREYVSKWLKKNEERHSNSGGGGGGGGDSLMVAAFRRARQMYATHVRWEYEVGKKKFVPFDDLASSDLEKRFIEGLGECVFDTNNEIFEVDLDAMIMYSEKDEYKLRRKITVLQAAEGDALANDSHTVVRDLPGSNTAASWTYKPHKDPDWQHFNRYQAFALERAFRESGLPDRFEIAIGGTEHVVVTVETVDPETGRHRGPHIRHKSEDAHSNKYSMIRRILVPREHRHASDVLWRLECPLMYAALAMQEARPGFSRAFRELEQSGEIVLRPESLDDGDDDIYAILRELVDQWSVAPTAFTVPGEMLRYEVLIEGMWVPMVAMNNWLMQPSTVVTSPKPSVTSLKALPSYIHNPNGVPMAHLADAIAKAAAANAPIPEEKRSVERVVFLFKQWLPFDVRTMTVYLPPPEGSGEQGKVLWCRVAEEHDSIVRFLLRDNVPWICGRDLLMQSSMMPRKFLDANHIVCCPDHTAAECDRVLAWASQGFPKSGDAKPLDCQRAAEFLGFDKQWSGIGTK